MSTKVREKARDLMNHREVARRCSISTTTLKSWAAVGEWPLPHSIIMRTWFYPVDVIEHWIATGEWPEGTKFKAGEGRGRVL